MEHSNVPGDGSLFSRDTSNAASDKLEIINALSAVVQSLLKSALHLNAMVEPMESPNLVALSLGAASC